MGRSRDRAVGGVEEKAPMTARRLALRGCQIAASIGLLAYLIVTIPMRDVFAALLSARPPWLVGGIALVGVTNLLAALQMRSILAAQGIIFSVRQIAGVNLVTDFYGLFLPSYLAGGVIRWHHFSKPGGTGAQALAAMIFSREVELVTTLGYGVVFYYLANSSVTARSALITLIVALTLAALIVLISVSAWPHAALRRALMQFGFPRRVTQGVAKVSASLVDFGLRGRGHHLRFLALCIIRNAFGVAAFICFARALRIAAPAMDLGWIRAVLDLVLILPVSIAGLGVRDASLVTMLGHLGVASAAALAFSFVLLARTLFVALLGGLVEGLRLYYGIPPGFVDQELKQTTYTP
jgi:glycosyltransferase 2 family protein